MILDQALVAAERDDCYQALKLVRRIIQYEDAVLGKTADITPQQGTHDHHAQQE
jgi:flagellar protein FlbT